MPIFNGTVGTHAWPPSGGAGLARDGEHSYSCDHMLAAIARGVGRSGWAAYGNAVLPVRSRHQQCLPGTPRLSAAETALLELARVLTSLDQRALEQEDEEGYGPVNFRVGTAPAAYTMHYDFGDNILAQLGGSKRVVLAPPTQLPFAHIDMRPESLSNGRHTYIDFVNTKPRDVLRLFPESGKFHAIEARLTAGQALYIPSRWFHFILNEAAMPTQPSARGPRHSNRRAAILPWVSLNFFLPYEGEADDAFATAFHSCDDVSARVPVTARTRGAEAAAQSYCESSRELHVT